MTKPAMHREEWDGGEIEFLRKNMREHDLPWIAGKLKRTVAAVAYRITKLKTGMGPWGLNRSWGGIRGQVPRPAAAQLKHGVRVVNLFTFAEYIMTGLRRGEGICAQVEVVAAVYENGKPSQRTFWVRVNRIALVSIFRQWYPRRSEERRNRIRVKYAAQLQDQSEFQGREGQSLQGHA